MRGKTISSVLLLSFAGACDVSPTNAVPAGVRFVVAQGGYTRADTIRVALINTSEKLVRYGSPACGFVLETHYGGKWEPVATADSAVVGCDAELLALAAGDQTVLAKSAANLAVGEYRFTTTVSLTNESRALLRSNSFRVGTND